MPPPLTPEEQATVTKVREAISPVMIGAINRAAAPMFDDRSISMFTLMLGIVQVYIDGLASALATLEPATRDPLIASMPQQLNTIIERDAK